jgi:hypothetical protein
MLEQAIYIYGGFELDSPNIPTDMVTRINLVKLFQGNDALYTKYMASQAVTNKPYGFNYIPAYHRNPSHHN